MVNGRRETCTSQYVDTVLSVLFGSAVEKRRDYVLDKFIFIFLRISMEALDIRHMDMKETLYRRHGSEWLVELSYEPLTQKSLHWRTTIFLYLFQIYDAIDLEESISAGYTRDGRILKDLGASCPYAYPPHKPTIKLSLKWHFQDVVLALRRKCKRDFRLS